MPEFGGEEKGICGIYLNCVQRGRQPVSESQVNLNRLSQSSSIPDELIAFWQGRVGRVVRTDLQNLGNMFTAAELAVLKVTESP